MRGGRVETGMEVALRLKRMRAEICRIVRLKEDAASFKKKSRDFFFPPFLSKLEQVCRNTGKKGSKAESALALEMQTRLHEE